MGDAEKLAEAARALWPAPSTVHIARGGEPVPAGTSVVREFVFVPNARSPRLLLPTAPAIAAAAVRRFSHDLPVAERVRRAAIAAAVRSGLPDRLLRDRLRIVAPDPSDADSIERVLSELLGTPVQISLGVGSARANRKPILGVFDETGGDVAFVKVGDSEMAQELVAAEADSLRTLGRRSWTLLEIPRLIALERWNDLDLLVISTLPTEARRWQPADAVPHAAMAELARSAGTDTVPLRSAPFWSALSSTFGRVCGAGATGPAEHLRALHTSLTRSYGDQELEVGAWHGDWAPWNMAWHRGIVRLWDWERYAEGVPVGFDALHYLLRVALRDLSDQDSAARALHAGAPAALTALGVPSHAHEMVVRTYLLELAARYTEAAHGPIGAPLLPRAQWVRDLLGHLVGPT